MSTIEDRFREIVRQELDELRRELAELRTPAPGEGLVGHEYLGPEGKKPFLRAARTGEFTAYKVGRRLVARRDDVDRWLEKKRVIVEVEVSAEGAPDVAERRLRLVASRGGR